MSLSKKRLLSASKTITGTHTLHTEHNSINSSAVKTKEEEWGFIIATNNRFDWFHTALQYTPMWVITTPHVTQSSLILRFGCYGMINQFALILLILSFSYITFVWLAWNGRTHEHNTLDYLDTILFEGIYVLWQILFLFNRYLAAFHFSSMICCVDCRCCMNMYKDKKQEIDINDDINDQQQEQDTNSKYCMKQYGFHYNWLEHGIYWNDKLQICKRFYLYQTDKTHSLTLVFVILYLVFMAGNSAIFFYYDYVEQSYVEAISDGLEILVLWIPICLSQICPVLIFHNYQMSLFTLNMFLKNNKQSGQVLESYCALYNTFQKDMLFWSYYFTIQIFTYFLDTWSIVFQLLQNDLGAWNCAHITVSRLFYGLPILYLLIASNRLGVEFNKFMKRVAYKMVKEHTSLQLYSYIIANKLVFKIIGFEVKYSNCIKLLLIFIITEVVSYSVTK